ncbi:hypothetical protein [Saccharopolyspora phatthalungensis]|uniref:Uncharacterized protein n=1 Tax=Saccharopolyspora phatthalungensis TaxID=664693 RepID=A0A840QGQ6_9PSEU|nr:hypothetical protein [Saccharopolyspora phatthalungensis]MBB5159676.1 hypothetical protein [Saccharopolyspora phatthalungensis]
MADDIVSGQGYRVDLDALMDAGLGVAEIVDEVRTGKIERADGPPEVYGHSGLATEIADFCDRAAQAAGYLTEDGMLLARLLIDSAGEYATADENGVAHLGDVAVEEASQRE